MKRIIAVLSVLSIIALLFVSLEYWLPRSSIGDENSDAGQVHDSPDPKRTEKQPRGQDQVQPQQAEMSDESSPMDTADGSSSIVAAESAPTDLRPDAAPSGNPPPNVENKRVEQVTVSPDAAQDELHHEAADALQQPEQYEAYARIMSQTGAYAIIYNTNSGEMKFLKNQPRNYMNRYRTSYLNELTAGINRKDRFLHGVGAEYEFVVARRFDKRTSTLTVIIVKGNYEKKQRAYQRMIYREIEPGRLHIRIIDAAGKDVEEPYTLIIDHSFVDYIQQRIDKPLMV